MSFRSLIRSAGVVVCGALLFMSQQSALAVEPDGVVRTFGFVTSLAADVEGELWFLDEDSLAVVAAPRDRSVQSLLQFVPDGDTDLRVDGTTWVYQNSTHVTAGPAGESVTGTFVWLLTSDPELGTPEPPPLGTVTFSGPDSPCILDQRVLYRRQCTGGACGSSNNGKYFTTDKESAQDVFVVVTAVFSR